VHCPLQLLLTSIFSRKFIMYHYIHALRHEVRGPQTCKPLTGRLLVYAGRQGGDSLVFRAANCWTRFESRGKFIFLLNFIKFDYYLCIYYLYIFSNLLFILIYILFFYCVYIIFFFKKILFYISIYIFLLIC
jgi:hypothetical protein